MSRLRRCAGTRKQLLKRDELITLSRERVDRLQRGAHAGGVRIVQLHVVAVLCVLHDMVRLKVAAADAPVHCVYGPEDQRDGNALLERIAGKAPRRANPVFAAAKQRAQRIGCPGDLIQLVRTGGVQPDVGKAVVADLMSFLYHL